MIECVCRPEVDDPTIAYCCQCGKRLELEYDDWKETDDEDEVICCDCWEEQNVYNV